ncbi:MAG: divergent polysaccharide deacetylase family protein [Oceanospirillaceae bacterium]|nr:divergent polysaccharide deacetylase family protein [Oceanospirillaceae bacterium]
MRRRGLLRALLAGPALFAGARAAVASRRDAVEQPRLIIVIDDLGNALEAGRATLALPGPLDVAVLPHSPYGAELAREARRLGKEVMLHAPMANRQHLALGPGALTPDMDSTSFQQTLRNALDSVPGAIGLNNHMGSLLTARREPMEWVMEVLAERGLLFVDSRTSADTLAWDVARERGIPAMMRDVFLDHEQTEAAIDLQFRRALGVAREYGSALMIGHPYPVTLDYLNRTLPALDGLGFQRLTVSAFLRQQADFARLDPADGRLFNSHRRHWGRG